MGRRLHLQRLWLLCLLLLLELQLLLLHECLLLSKAIRLVSMKAIVFSFLPVRRQQNRAPLLTMHL